MSDLKITRESSDQIGFVVACAMCGAISVEELNKWAEYIIKENPIEDIPDYIFELVYFKDFLSRIFKLIGFVPSTKWLPEGGLEAYGITALRGRLSPDAGVDASKAITALDKRPDIIQRFKQVFPFIDLSAEIFKP